MKSKGSFEYEPKFMSEKARMQIAKRITCKNLKSACSQSPDAVDSRKPKEKIYKEVFEDYIECSSVHGVKYFGKLSIEVGYLGKILWTLTLIAGIVCSGLMVMQFLRRYYDNPTITYIESFYVPVYMAPFPAVTICPFTPPPLERRLIVLSDLRLPPNMSDEEALMIIKYGHDLSRPPVVEREKYLSNFKALLDENGLRLTDFLKAIKPCEDIVESCWWNGKQISCADYFQISHTSQGICCSFNYLLEEFIATIRDAGEPQLRYTEKYGPYSGLKLVLRKEIVAPDDDNTELSKMITNSDGVLVSVHHSTEYPSDELHGLVLQANHELQISVNPSVYHKPPGFYHQNKRGEVVPICIPSEDKPLKYFPKYQYTNCYSDCRIRAMIEICGCVTHQFDFVAKEYNVATCELDGLDCINRHMEKIRIVKDVYMPNFTCSCRTPCQNVIYEGLPVVIALDAREFSPHYQGMSDGQAVLRVYMGAQVFKTYRTVPAADEIYLLGSVGGIFSLFLGCSFLSAVEVVYFAGLLFRKIFSRPKPDTASRQTRQTASHNNFEDVNSLF